MTTEVSQLVDSTTKLTEEVTGQKDRLTAAADMAAAKAAEAGTFASQATEAAATAVQISRIADVDDAVAASQQDTVAEALEKASGGRMYYKLDANGNRQVVCRIPVFTYDDVASVIGTNFGGGVVDVFRRQDASIRPYIEVAAYQAANIGGKPVCQPGLDPWDRATWDEADAACRGMGAGWILSDVYVWAAIGLWCLANGCQPTGNTEYGRSHVNKFDRGLRQDGLLPNERLGEARILTGSGPDSWRHDGTPYGISDLVGNTWEWGGGLKTVDGQIYVAPYVGAPELEWVAQSAFLDAGNKLNSSKTASASTNVAWGSTGKDASYVSNTLLQQLLIEPIPETASLEGRLYYNNDGDRLPFRGGDWGSGSIAGLAALNLYNERSYRYGGIGFRPAFIAS